MPVFDDELAEAVTRFTARAKAVLFIEHLVGDFPVRRSAGATDFKRPTDPSDRTS